ncbi:MAG: Wzz/FepE/Etk N-terminal domain-containing protein, partial [Candidatus Didemnitutus sp.]|nr:Wzz/FepE/Etk N-terminal domain-containing protein [Candidatus Didemnitutus sp.]
MEPQQSEKGSGSGAYPYTYYGNNQGDYGGADTTMQRGFQDYVLILRERVWYILVVFLLVFSSAVVYTFTRTKDYMSVASVQIFRRDPVVMQIQGVVDNEIRSAEDLNTQVKVLESLTIVKNVADRLTGEDLRQFLAPYVKGNGDDEPVDAARIIFGNRKVVPVRLSLIIQVQYTHPDKFVAAKVA